MTTGSEPIPLQEGIPDNLLCRDGSGFTQAADSNIVDFGDRRRNGSRGIVGILVETEEAGGIAGGDIIFARPTPLG